MIFRIGLLILAVLSIGSATAHAADATGTPEKSTKTSFSPGSSSPSPAARAAEASTLVFTSPPRESPAEGKKIYGPVATFLGKVIGKHVQYRHPGTWGAYRSEMLRGDYDIVFDGPHLNSYRVERLHHNILVKVPGLRDFAVITSKDAPYNELSQLGGRTICTHAPPNLGTLILLSQFNNPSRQPAIMATDGWDKIFHAVATGRCVAGVIPAANLKKLDSDGKMKVVFKSRPLPDQAFSAGPRISPEEQAKIAEALISPDAAPALEKLRAAFKINDKLVGANNGEYAGIAVYLRSEYGYY
jgi:ABC-type phosphate/phosphonate transport system substrate-binding protein